MTDYTVHQTETCLTQTIGTAKVDKAIIKTYIVNTKEQVMSVVIGIVVAFFLLALVLVAFASFVEFIFSAAGWLLVGALIVGGLLVVGAGQPVGWVAVVLGGIILLGSGGG